MGGGGYWSGSDHGVDDAAIAGGVGDEREDVTESDDTREEAEATALEDTTVSKGYLRTGFDRVRPFLEAC